MANNSVVNSGFTSDEASRTGDPEDVERLAKTDDTMPMTLCTTSKSASAGVCGEAFDTETLQSWVETAKRFAISSANGLTYVAELDVSASMVAANFAAASMTSFLRASLENPSSKDV